MAAESTKQKTGVYVYGILPGDIELTSDMTGVGDPAGQVRVVRSGDLTALVSEVDLSGPLGSPEDLAAHKEILDACAADAPVLPMRFGAVVASEEAVTRELLDEHHDEFAGALGELDGKAQYVVKGRYVGNVILTEVLSENKRAARLRGEIRGADSDATREARIQLGEIINDAVTLKREKDTRALGKAMADHCEASLVRDPTHELDAVHVAFLVRVDQEKEIERAVKNLSEQWDGRVELRLLGPMAAYDFIAATEPGG
jgi:Gas vesicle synthesis protein GvpL/GvpF